MLGNTTAAVIDDGGFRFRCKAHIQGTRKLWVDATDTQSSKPAWRRGPWLLLLLTCPGASLSGIGQSSNRRSSMPCRTAALLPVAAAAWQVAVAMLCCSSATLLWCDLVERRERCDDNDNHSCAGGLATQSCNALAVPDQTLDYDTDKHFRSG